MSEKKLPLNKAHFTDKEWENARSLSGIVVDGEHLWVGCDEGTKLERLARDAADNYGSHSRFPLASLLDLPGGDAEVDVEGLDVDDGYLWVVGSHGLKRAKPKKNDSVSENLARMQSITADGNRYLLGRVPIDSACSLVAVDGVRMAARLEGDANGNALSNALRADKLTGPFCTIPSKDNGVDVEGLAVRGGRVYAGLRGPVLRGWAIVLDFEVAESVPGRLKLKGAIRRHLLQLGGLGVRDLAIRGKDLYILSGPTMDLDGPCIVWRWKNALDESADSMTPQGSIEKLLEIPVGMGDDHPEGLALMDGAAGRLCAVICYDTPSADRLKPDGQTSIGVFDLP